MHLDAKIFSCVIGQLTTVSKWFRIMFQPPTLCNIITRGTVTEVLCKQFFLRTFSLGQHFPRDFIGRRIMRLLPRAFPLIVLRSKNVNMPKHQIFEVPAFSSSLPSIMNPRNLKIFSCNHEVRVVRSEARPGLKI